jgi:hypothetical protein
MNIFPNDTKFTRAELRLMRLVITFGITRGLKTARHKRSGEEIGLTSLIRKMVSPNKSVLFNSFEKASMLYREYEKTKVARSESKSKSRTLLLHSELIRYAFPELIRKSTPKHIQTILNRFGTPRNEFKILIDTGSAQPEHIAQILSEISSLYRMMGGTGISYSVEGVAQSMVLAKY